ncbi:MAG: diacylglycerol kinase family lipid kinase [Saprospiraceae bacterium]|nr:diacylglycerol kinase family lipid kinase [Saprospiraceae bacterium]
MQTPSPPPFWYIIANPAARNGAMGRHWPDIERWLQELGFAYSVQFTEHRGHAARLIEDALLKGGRYIMGIGGDGTNHELVHGLFSQTFVPPSEVFYTLLPFGTGNDWAREHGIPVDPRRRLEQLHQGKMRAQDIGRVQYQRDGETRSRYFVNVAGMAYDGFIGQKLTEHPARNKVHYLLKVAQYLRAYRLSKARIVFDGQTVEDHFYTINIGLCRYSAGGMQLVPHAVPDDGLFALTFARSLSKLEVLLQTPRFYNGTILSHRSIEGHQARHIRVEHLGETPTLLEADGEFLGETPVTFELLEKALNVMI